MSETKRERLRMVITFLSIFGTFQRMRQPCGFLSLCETDEVLIFRLQNLVQSTLRKM